MGATVILSDIRDISRRYSRGTVVSYSDELWGFETRSLKNKIVIQIIIYLNKYKEKNITFSDFNLQFSYQCLQLKPYTNFIVI